MQEERNIREKLSELYDHRLSLRCRRLLKRCFRNCKHNKRVSLEDNGGEFEGRFGLCMNPEVTGTEDAVFRCGNERERHCKYYKPRYTSKEEVKREFDAELKDPKVAGQHEPKIAVLMWVLQSVEPEKSKGVLAWFKRNLRRDGSV